MGKSYLIGNGPDCLVPAEGRNEGRHGNKGWQNKTNGNQGSRPSVAKAGKGQQAATRFSDNQHDARKPATKNKVSQGGKSQPTSKGKGAGRAVQDPELNLCLVLSHKRPENLKPKRANQNNGVVLTTSVLNR